MRLLKIKTAYLSFISILGIVLVNMIYGFDLQSFLGEKSTDDSKITSELPSKTELGDIYDYAYNLSLKNDFSSAKDTVKYVKDYVDNVRKCDVSESELYSIFLNSQQGDMYSRFALNLGKTNMKEIVKEKEKFSKACRKLTNCINGQKDSDDTAFSSTHFVQCRNIFTDIYSLSKTSVNNNRKLKQGNAGDDMYANGDTQDSAFDLLNDIDQISKLMYKEPDKPQKINFFEKSSGGGNSSGGGSGGAGKSSSGGGGSYASSGGGFTVNLMSGAYSSSISSASNNSSISSTYASVFQKQLEQEYTSNQQSSLLVGNQSSVESNSNNQIVLNPTLCTSGESYANTGSQYSESQILTQSSSDGYIDTQSVYDYNNSLGQSQDSDSSSIDVQNYSQASSTAASLLSDVLSDSGGSSGGGASGGGNGGGGGGSSNYSKGDTFKCSGGEGADDLLTIKICSVKNSKKSVSGSKSVMSVEEIVDELDNLLTNMIDKGALMKHKHTDEYMETGLQDIKLKDIFSFDMVVAYKPIFKKSSKSKDKEKNEKKQQEEENEKRERYILQNYQDETIKQERNKYLVINDPVSQEGTQKIGNDPGLQQINTKIIDQFNVEKDAKIDTTSTTGQTKIYNAVFEQTKDFLDSSKKGWEAIAQALAVVRKTSKALKEKVEGGS